MSDEKNIGFAYHIIPTETGGMENVICIIVTGIRARQSPILIKTNPYL